MVFCGKLISLCRRNAGFGCAQPCLGKPQPRSIGIANISWVMLMARVYKQVEFALILLSAIPQQTLYCSSLNKLYIHVSRLAKTPFPVFRNLQSIPTPTWRATLSSSSFKHLRLVFWVGTIPPQLPKAWPVPPKPWQLLKTNFWVFICFSLWLRLSPRWLHHQQGSPGGMEMQVQIQGGLDLWRPPDPVWCYGILSRQLLQPGLLPGGRWGLWRLLAFTR